MAHVKVCILIVTYNAKPWMDFCLAPFARLPEGWTVLVVDNASADGTPDRIAEAYPQATVVANKENLGFGRANNIGLRLALDQGAEHVLLLNQDARIAVEDVRRLVDLQRANPEYGIVSPIHLNGAGDECDLAFAKYCAPALCPGLLLDGLRGKLGPLYRTESCNAAVWLVSRACLGIVGGFNPLIFHYGEDDDYVNRVRYHGLAIGLAPGVYARHDREQKASTRPLDFHFIRTLIKFLDPARKPPSVPRLLFVFLPILVRNMLRGRPHISRHYTRVLLHLLKERALPEAARNPGRQRGETYL